MTPFSLLDAVWADYVASTPQALRIQRLLASSGERVENDHIALRTFGVRGLGLDVIAGAFEELGWVARERFRSEAEHVRGRAWEHADPELPKLLISEVLVGELPIAAQRIIESLVAQVPPGFAGRRDLVHAGRPWDVTVADHAALREHSEAAAWVAAFGVRAHHVRVDIEAMSMFPDLVALDAFLGDHGFSLDAASATCTDMIEVELADGAARIPSGTYGFGLRSRRARERREVIVELEQNVDIHADELNAHAVRRRPAHHRR